MNQRDRRPEEQSYWRDRPSWEDEYGFGRHASSGSYGEQYRPDEQRPRRRDEGGWGNRSPREQYGRERSSELFDRERFGRGDEPRYYGTGAAGWGGPGFTGGGYGWGDGSRSEHLPLEGDYSDESTLSYDHPMRRDYRGAGDAGRSRRRYPPGPKGYQRSDERVKEDISERLYGAYHIDSSEVSVEVRAGKVTLEGVVPSRHMKHAIEDMVDGCPGVMEIDNRIRVAGPNYQGSSPASPSPSSSPTVKSSTKQ